MREGEYEAGASQAAPSQAETWERGDRVNVGSPVGAPYTVHYWANLYTSGD